MLTIRYLRAGKKNQPFYRVVVTDKKNPPRAGRFLEIVGFVNPFTKEKQIKADRIKYWLSVGAKTSDTVNNLLVQEKIIEAKKKAVHKKPKKKALEAKAKAQVVKSEAEKPAEPAAGEQTSTDAEAMADKPAVEEPKPAEETASGPQGFAESE